MAETKRLTDTGNLLIHQFRNCVHRINMELDLAERGLPSLEYADLISAVNSMDRLLDELRVRLVRITEQGTDIKIYKWTVRAGVDAIGATGATIATYLPGWAEQLECKPPSRSQAS
jgi:hypothetical protein